MTSEKEWGKVSYKCSAFAKTKRNELPVRSTCMQPVKRKRKEKRDNYGWAQTAQITSLSEVSYGRAKL
jgi:hypothetical protein